MSKAKREVTTIYVKHLTHVHCGVRKYEKEGEVFYNFTIHFKHKHHTVILQSLWYHQVITCVLDCISIFEPLDPLVASEWPVLHDEKIVVACLVNEINAKYLSKIIRREDTLRGASLPLSVSNRGEHLARKLKKLAMQKAQVPRITREEHQQNFRVWEEFDFELL